MFRTGGGGALPPVDGPLEALVVLVIVAAIAWGAFKLFSS
jgi:hypothetical protein